MGMNGLPETMMRLIDTRAPSIGSSSPDKSPPNTAPGEPQRTWHLVPVVLMNLVHGVFCKAVMPQLSLSLRR